MWFTVWSSCLLLYNIRLDYNELAFLVHLVLSFFLRSQKITLQKTIEQHDVDEGHDSQADAGEHIQVERDHGMIFVDEQPAWHPGHGEETEQDVRGWNQSINENYTIRWLLLIRHQCDIQATMRRRNRMYEAEIDRSNI